MSIKTELEFKHIQAFLETMDSALVNNLNINCIDDKPDCIIDNIGIEHTQCIIDERIEHIKYRNNLCLQIRQHLQVSNISGLEVNVCFDHIEQTSKMGLVHIGKEIGNFLIDNLGRHPHGEFDELVFGQTELAFLWYTKIDNSDDVQIIPTNADWVETLNKDKLNKIISTKEVKLAHYSRTLEEIWLLIVIDSMSEAGYIDIDENITKEIITSSFNQVYVFKYPERKIYQLKKNA